MTYRVWPYSSSNFHIVFVTKGRGGPYALVPPPTNARLINFVVHLNMTTATKNRYMLTLPTIRYLLIIIAGVAAFVINEAILLI